MIVAIIVMPEPTKYTAVAGKKQVSREYPKGTRGAKGRKKRDRCREEERKKLNRRDKESTEAANLAALGKNR
ncbi:MAG: hypothetical protein DHS20C11_25640 [Lysobacteraceae bacterium]|nr:MAG: hypothetical protein DHS20C11_25640 [Xanthomonadaceae bacterium]